MALTDVEPEPNRKTSKGLAAILPYTTVAMILAALYVAWTFYSRHESARKTEEAAENRQQELIKRKANAVLGSGEIKFTVFSADNGIVQAGGTTQLCYGVVNATSLKIDPPVDESIKPTERHCLSISPKKTTTYTMTASNDKGETKTSSLTVQVR